MNWKTLRSILLQGIIDERGRVINIFAGPPGRLRDASTSRASCFYSEWQEKMGGGNIIMGHSLRQNISRT